MENLLIQDYHKVYRDFPRSCSFFLFNLNQVNMLLVIIGISIKFIYIHDILNKILICLFYKIDDIILSLHLLVDRFNIMNRVLKFLSRKIFNL